MDILISLPEQRNRWFALNNLNAEVEFGVRIEKVDSKD
jgi:hypothetical protein